MFKNDVKEMWQAFKDKYKNKFHLREYRLWDVVFPKEIEKEMIADMKSMMIPQRAEVKAILEVRGIKQDFLVDGKSELENFDVGMFKNKVMKHILTKALGFEKYKIPDVPASRFKLETIEKGVHSIPTMMVILAKKDDPIFKGKEDL